MAVYFARIDGDPFFAPIKIGYAANPAKRLETLQCGHYRNYIFFRVVEGSPADERRIHKLFHHLRRRGEWFDFCSSMLGDIDAIDLPCPQPITPTLRGGPMPEPHRSAIQVGVARSWNEGRLSRSRKEAP